MLKDVNSLKLNNIHHTNIILHQDHKPQVISLLGTLFQELVLQLILENS